MNENVDVVVVGGGVAGLSAALTLTRARRSVAVVDAGAPRNATVAESHGFLTRDGSSPGELLALGRAEVAGYGGELIVDTVRQVEPGFTVTLASGRVLLARRLLLATGARDELPDLPGVRELWGGDVQMCPYCHGYEVADLPIGVLGTQERSPHQALLLRQWSPDVVYFPDHTTLSDEERERLLARGVGIVEGEVRGLSVHNGRLRAVRLADEVVPRSALFLAPRFTPNGDLHGQLGVASDETGFPHADPTGRTSVPGVWVAGNARDPFGQLIMAAAEGARTAAVLNADLMEEEVAWAQRPVSASIDRG